MALKKEIKPWLKEVGLTWEQIDALWEELCEPYEDNEYLCHKAGLLKRCGKSWNTLSLHEIKKIPTLKETLIKKFEEEKKAKEQEIKAAKKKEEADKYYSEHFEEIMVQKIDKGEPLTEREIKAVCFEMHQIEETVHDSGRWTSFVSTVVEMCGRKFCVDWQRGLTEMQENVFYDQPYEVKEHTYEKTITVTEWVKVNK